MKPNAFQDRMRSHIEGLLAKKGRSKETKWHDGAEESFFEIGFPPYTAWIYDDEAQLSGPGLDQRFEFHDYGSLDALEATYSDFVQNFIRSLA
jgi:hypothetical protein